MQKLQKSKNLKLTTGNEKMGLEAQTRTLVFLLVFLLALAIIQPYARANMGLHLYGTTLGPFVEEAFKGACVVLFVFLFLYPPYAEKLKWWVVTGMGVGLLFGLSETFLFYKLGLHRVLPTVGHVFWTTIMTVGIWWFKHVRRKGLLYLGTSYVCASVLHVFWNYYNI
jgi:hypothetical protein